MQHTKIHHLGAVFVREEQMPTKYQLSSTSSSSPFFKVISAVEMRQAI